ncbi:hypothetical protein CWO91_05460 [Bradyrhizobium genosp. SA-3]|uniref:hypothetical protein n=1 Tax=Bradyrhizobium genosp. SA-3 TaxID=508868 RepID=UPI001028ECEB|nr:hypothetical protein [Bradyrhizobium genosp. SA-3]RZN12136.1 hypothetical protein CWO91_05460 [Bradyrhizobium genosp. SA-3]
MKAAMGAAEKARELIHGGRQGRSLDDLLFSTVNLFDRAVDRVERELAINEQALQRSQREQNGSEVRSVEPERLTAEVLAFIECRDAMELRLTLGLTLWTSRQPRHAHLGDD